MSMMRPHSAKNILHIADQEDPKFFFTQQALFKIQCYVEECPDEIGWLGRVINENNVYVCDEVFLIRQEVAAATTEITAAGLVELINEIGLDENETLRLWGHSHVNGSTGPSGQDKNQMDLFEKNDCDWFFRIICNKRGDIGVTFFNWKKNYYIEDMEWNVLPMLDNALRDAIKAEIKDKVTKLNYGRRTEFEGTGNPYGRYIGNKWWPWGQNPPEEEEKKQTGGASVSGKGKQKGKEKETQVVMRGTTTTSTCTDSDTATRKEIDLSKYEALVDDMTITTWNLLLEPDARRRGGEYSTLLPVYALMRKYQLTYQELLDVVEAYNAKEEEESAEFLKRCILALGEIKPEKHQMMLNYPAMESDAEVQAAMQKYDIPSFGDLIDALYDMKMGELN